MFHFDIDFKDKNGERYMLPTRLRVLLGELWGKAFYFRKPLDGVEARDGKYAADDHSGNWYPFDCVNSFWGGKDTYIWFRHQFTVPEELDGKVLWYSVEAGDNDYWQWANPQMCLYLNGHCIAGMDSNHRDVEFTTCAKAGDTYEVYISGYTDTCYFERPVRFRPILASVEPKVLALYYDLKVAFDAAHEMEVDDISRVDLIHHVNEAFNLLQMHESGDRFLASVAEASAYVEKNIYCCKDDARRPVIAAVGSTHIDVAWLWRYEQTREKAIRSFATALLLLEKNPEYIFMCSQPQLYQFVKEDDPELYARIKEQVALGRWEVEGAMWVEADTNLASGESLVRQVLHGKRFYRQEFGKEAQVLWLPDVFGYSAALPQILKKSGVPYFMTTKISWNEFNKVPYDTFHWRGIDGSSVLSHFIATREKVQEEKDWMTTYNGQLNPSSVLGAWQRYQQKDLNREILASFGHGDGGGGTSQLMIENGRRLAKGLPGMPKLKFSGVQEYYHRLEKDLEGKKRIPCWDGELYFEYHRGTYTSQAGIKLRNRKNEIRSHDAETLSVIANLLKNLPYPKEELDASWKKLLLNQFHDVIPGSSIGPVYKDAYEHHAFIQETTEKAISTALDTLASEIPGDGIAVFNTLSFQRSAPASFSWETEGNIALRSGDKLLPATKGEDGLWHFIAEDVPAKGYRCYQVISVNQLTEAPSADMNVLENEYCRIEFDSNMNISRYFCKQENRDLMGQGSLAGRLIAFEDKPAVDDAWNLMVYYDEKSWFIDEVNAAYIVENSALREVIRVERPFRNSKFAVDYILYHDRPGLDIRCEIDWKESNVLVKMDFPVKVNTTKASFDIQFGSVERPIHKNTLWDHARFEVCAHKWVDLSDNGFGLSLLNDCKYGYDINRDHIRLSVLRSSTYPDPDQDKCHHEFALRLLPHSGAVDLPQVNCDAYSFNYPLYTRVVTSGGNLPAEYSLLQVGADNVIIETIKQAEDGDDIVLRAFECANKTTNAVIKLNLNGHEAFEADLMEENLIPLCYCDGNLDLHFEPFEIKTVLLRKKALS